MTFHHLEDDEKGTRTVHTLAPLAEVQNPGLSLSLKLRKAEFRLFNQNKDLGRSSSKNWSVLFQFPRWVTAAPKALAHVEHCAERMHPLLTAFEFRHESWFNEKHRESTLAMERERGIVHVIVDAPEGVTGRAHTVWEVTSLELAIVRLHGRNAETWSGAASAAGRFNYEYSEEELRELVAPIDAIAKRARRTHVLFNNSWRGVAQRNAMRLMSLVKPVAQSP